MDFDFSRTTHQLVTLNDCHQLIAQLWRFLHRSQVESNNNQAERQLRHGGIWYKKYLGTQSERGKRFTERILTCTLICRQQERSLREFANACLARIGTMAIIPLIAGEDVVRNKLNSYT